MLVHKGAGPVSEYYNLSFPTFRYVHSYFTPETVILDIGCSSGSYLQMLPPGSFGFDADLTALRNCRENGMRVVSLDANKPLPIGDSSVSGILASHILEHLRSPIFFLEECARVLAPQGTLVLGLPIEGGLSSPWLNYYQGHRGVYGHLYSFSPDNLKELFHIIGLDYSCLYFHIAVLGRKKQLSKVHDLLQGLPASILYKLSSAYWIIAKKP